MEASQINGQMVQLILHSDRGIYSVGESIRPKLQIKNHNSFPIGIHGVFVFSGDKIAFSSPNAAHLIGPEGQDLLLPYQHSTSFPGFDRPIKVGAKGEEWLYLPITSHLHLRQPGEYTFWLELLDDLGQLHRSNQIRFQLVDVVASVPPEFIGLTLASQKLSFATTEHVRVEVVFTNKFDKPLTFLKPQEDSFDGWVNPVYQFTVVDSANRSLALALRSGTMAIPIYDATTQFTIAPGKSYRQRLQLPDFPEMHNPGKYRVRLTYIVRDKAIGKGGVVLDKPMNWGASVFTGRLESNEVTITIK